MATRAPTNSILKRPASTYPTVPSTTTPQQERDRRNRHIAVQHALVIEHQKNVQATILESLQMLMEFPATTTFTVTEADTFTNVVKTFQPCDLDDLVEERTIDGRCGYILCSNAPRTVESHRAWRLPKGAQSWCSNACAEKGLFVRTQLSEVPAWERRPGETPDVALHEDDRNALHTNAPNDIRVRSAITRQDDLAAERGEKTTSLKPKQVMTDDIVEKPTKMPSNVQVKFSDQSSTAIEGYEPKAPSIKETSKDSDHADLSFWEKIDQQGMGIDVHRISGTEILDDESDSDKNDKG